MTASQPRRRRPPKIDTERALSMRSCARHLKDLRRAQKRPPANVPVSERGAPKFVAPIIEQSYCTSPAAFGTGRIWRTRRSWLNWRNWERN